MKDDVYISYPAKWQGFSFEVRYCEDYCKASTGFEISHLEVISENKEPLPITKTGYRSLFLSSAEIDSYGGPVSYVTAWIEAEGKKPRWKASYEASRQGTLF